ncbi:MAG TPA: SMC-Scp complex subunit ScpB [Candidatus Magasanikbacteria bacterium]|nr:SMC-Scp complex subunit ScpB [Candidatus Magasanikbacteria bacterium]
MNLLSQIESILFVASKPLKTKQIAKAVQKNEIEVAEALSTLQMKYNQDNSGIRILHEGDEYQMATAGENSIVVDLFIKDEVSGELTKAQLETLTVVAYRGPITRPELEQIRGVNCAVIVRNLLMRGLVEEGEDENKILPVYRISLEALRHLGINSATELPDYENLHKHEFIETALTAE